MRGEGAVRGRVRCACVQLRQLCALLRTDARPGSTRVVETHRVQVVLIPPGLRLTFGININNRIYFKRVFMFNSDIKHSKCEES